MKQIPFLVGFLFASLFALGISVLGTNWWNWREIEPPVVLKDYWPVPFVFIFSLLVTAIILALPETANYVMAQYVDYHQKRLQAARYAREREQLNSPAPQPATGRLIENELSPHDRAWRHFLIRCAAESERAGGVSYQKMKVFFGQDRDKWRAYVDRLVRWEKCWPIEPRVETFLRPGITPTLIYDLLVGGQLPPALPPEDPPTLEQRQQPVESTGRNSGEIAVNSESTVYATDR